MNEKLKLFSVLFLLLASFSLNTLFGNTIFIKRNLEYEKYNDSTSIKLVHQFLQWYKQNKKTINIPIVKGGGKDSSTFYSIDYNEVEKYLKKLKSSGYFSTKFRKDLYAYINLCEAHFKKYPQNDFVAYGFEVDLITKLMDDLDFMDNIEYLKLFYVLLAKKNATISIRSIHSQEILVRLTKYSGKWKIDSINGDFVLN